MFKKHVYTCPDVIHDHRVAKRNAILSLVLWVASLVGLTIYGRRVDKRMDAELKEMVETPSAE